MSRKIIIIIIFFVLCAVIRGVFADDVPAGWRDIETYNRNMFKPFEEKYNFASALAIENSIRSEGHPIPVGHPRIFINADNKAQLRQKIAEHYLNWMQEAVNLAYASYGLDLISPGGHHLEPDAQPAALACGIIYQLGQIPGVDYHGLTPEQYGRDGIRHLLSLANLGLPSYGVANYQHMEYLGLPLGYDWLYELMNEPERQEVALKLLKIADPLDTTVDPWNNPPCARLLGALAVYADGIDDNEANRLIGLFYNGIVLGDPLDASWYTWKYNMLERGENLTYHHIFVPEGPGKEGYVYSHAYYFPFYPLLEAWYDQTGEDYFKMPFFQNWIFQAAHITGNQYEHYDKYTQLKNPSWDRSWAREAMPWLEMGYTHNNLSAAALAKYSQVMSNVRLSVRLIYMLRADPDLTAKSPSELGLPTTAHFRGVNNIFMRNSWQGIDTSWAWFQSPVWGANIRDLGPVNDFNIWKNGGMLLTKRSQDHDYDGGSRVNTFVLYDDTLPNAVITQKNIMDSATTLGYGGLGLDMQKGERLSQLNKDLAGYTEGLRYFEECKGEYDYMMGDGAKSFNENYDQKTKTLNRVKNWSRQFIWFRTDDNIKTDHFVVFDRIEKVNKNVVEHMMLNFNKNPEIRDRVTNMNQGDGIVYNGIDGIWQYEGANRIVASNNVKTDWGTAHARAFVDTLLPKNPVYYRAGGTTTRNIDLFGNLNQKNLPSGIINGSADDPQNILDGMWRVEITDEKNLNYATRPLKQLYLHTIQADDITKQDPQQTNLIEGDTLVGARTGANIVLFNKEEAVINSGEVIIPEGVNGTYRILIADLEPKSSYKVIINGSNINEGNKQTSEAGTLFLKDISFAENDTLNITRFSEERGACDINGDNSVDVIDVQICVNVLLGIVADPENKADVNGDNDVNVSDVQGIVNVILGN